MSPDATPTPGSADEAGGAALDAELRARVADWIDDDPDPVTRSVLENLLEQADAGDAAAAEEVRDAFSGDLEFGTAGLRGRMAPGPHRMNLAVVSRAARGLADHLTGDLGLALRRAGAVATLLAHGTAHLADEDPGEERTRQAERLLRTGEELTEAGRHAEEGRLD